MLKQHLIRQEDDRSDGHSELNGVLNATMAIWSRQQDPEGERYALAKVMQTYEEGLRAVFTYYCQLMSSCMKHWPPRMSRESWILFCKDSEISGKQKRCSEERLGVLDPRAGARIRSSQSKPMISVSEMERVCLKYACERKDDEGSHLSYEGFLACLIDCSSKLSNIRFLSEALRDIIHRYVLQAEKIVPPPRNTKKSQKKRYEPTKPHNSIKTAKAG